jgi:hypothetical protein
MNKQTSRLQAEQVLSLGVLCADMDREIQQLKNENAFLKRWNTSLFMAQRPTNNSMLTDFGKTILNDSFEDAIANY